MYVPIFLWKFAVAPCWKKGRKCHLYKDWVKLCFYRNIFPLLKRDENVASTIFKVDSFPASYTLIKKGRKCHCYTTKHGFNYGGSHPVKKGTKMLLHVANRKRHSNIIRSLLKKGRECHSYDIAYKNLKNIML